MSDKRRSTGKRSAPQRRTPVSTTLGDRIRKVRTERGLSQEVVAARAGISEGWFLQIENGQVEPRFSHIVAIADVLEVDLQQLAEDQPDDRRSSVSRAPVVPRPSTQDVVLDLDHLRRARARAGRIDAVLLDQLESQLGRHWTSYHTTSPAVLLPAVTDHIATVWPLVHQTLVGGTARRLHSLVAGTAGLAGWLALRLGHRSSSAVYWSLAENLASEAEDQTLRCFILASRSSLYSVTLRGDADGDTNLAVAFLDAGVAHESAILPIQQAWILARRAEEHAVRGEHDAAARDLGRSAYYLAQVQGRPAGYFAAWDSAQLTGYRGSCAALKGGAEAVDLLERSLAETNVSLISQRSSILANLAAAHAGQGRPDEACAMLNRAITVAAPNNLAVSIDRVRGVRARLERWSDTVAVRRLDEVITSLP